MKIDIFFPVLSCPVVDIGATVNIHGTMVRRHVHCHSVRVHCTCVDDMQNALRGNRTPGGSRQTRLMATTQVTTTPLMRDVRWARVLLAVSRGRSD